MDGAIVHRIKKQEKKAKKDIEPTQRYGGGWRGVERMVAKVKEMVGGGAGMHRERWKRVGCSTTTRRGVSIR